MGLRPDPDTSTRPPYNRLPSSMTNTTHAKKKRARDYTLSNDDEYALNFCFRDSILDRRSKNDNSNVPVSKRKTLLRPTPPDESLFARYGRSTIDWFILHHIYVDGYLSKNFKVAL